MKSISPRLLFMDKRIFGFLLDVMNSIEEIEVDLPNPRDFNLFVTNRTAKRAIERNLEIIGEAMSRILKIDPEIPVSNARKIVDFRNRIIHGYDSVSNEILWTISTRDLPSLKKETQAFLENNPRS